MKIVIGLLGSEEAIDVPCKPVIDNYEIELKLRNFTLESTIAEFGNPDGRNKRKFQKIEHPTRINICLDRDIYISIEAWERFQKVGIDSAYARLPITQGLIDNMEEHYARFFKDCVSRQELFFERPDMPCIRIPKTPDFEYY